MSKDVVTFFAWTKACKQSFAEASLAGFSFLRYVTLKFRNILLFLSADAISSSLLQTFRRFTVVRTTASKQAGCGFDPCSNRPLDG